MLFSQGPGRPPRVQASTTRVPSQGEWCHAKASAVRLDTRAGMWARVPYTSAHTHTHIIQLKWFDDTTEGWSRKTIPFQSLVLQGEQKWGHRAPYLEVCAHLTLTLS
jgi:hypothetical protein